jgi:DNA polymerase-3 subunit epsilon
VLDIGRLAAAVQPTIETSSFEPIAARLGISTGGQKTVLERAIATGEIFLKLVPLLKERGISTLRQAQQACAKIS